MRTITVFFLTCTVLCACGGKSEQAIRASIMQEQAIKNSIEQKSQYVEHLLSKIETLMLDNLKTDHDAAVKSVTKADGTANVATISALNSKYVEDLRLIQAAIKDARDKWIATLQDDMNALELNLALQRHLKAKIDTMKALNHNLDRVFDLIDRAFNKTKKEGEQ